MADAGDDGNCRIENGAGDDFFVEGPEIFHGTTAAREDKDVCKLALVEEAKSANDFLGGAIALNAHGKHGDVHVVKAALENANDVANGGAFGRSDESDAARKDRQRL